MLNPKQLKNAQLMYEQHTNHHLLLATFLSYHHNYMKIKSIHGRRMLNLLKTENRRTYFLCWMPKNCFNILIMSMQYRDTFKFRITLHYSKNREMKNIIIEFKQKLLLSQIQTLLSLLQVANKDPEQSHATAFTSFSCPSNVAIQSNSFSKK
jgi:hypothetical protein